MEWQPIETAPKEQGNSLLLTGFKGAKDTDGRWIVIGQWGLRYEKDDWYDPAESDYDYPAPLYRVTHWMPLPEPPRATE